MANYDFQALLSSLDFEILCKDLLEAELGLQFENFKDGKDQGIDLRCARLPGQNVIVQCKRYGQFSALKSTLKNEELPKIKKLEPSRYILATSVALSPQEACEIKKLLAPYVQSTGDVYGRDRLNSILTRNPDIERSHIKLWLNSTGVLDSLLNAGIHTVSREEVERAISASKIYVKNQSFDEALKILEKQRVCIISGVPGIGKTTLARMLLLHFYREGSQIIKIESDISEARAVAYHDKPRFYYYDDFLGQTAQADKLNKNEDQSLLDFMRSITESKNDYFVLTTREYILHQARLQYEKLAREDFDLNTCTIDFSQYSENVRADILYNHLHYSDLDSAYKEQIKAAKTYHKIVSHPNYSPRLIETLTSPAIESRVGSERYPRYFLDALDDPKLIWDHIFNYQLSNQARNLLFVLTSLPPDVMMDDLQLAFKPFHQEASKKLGVARGVGDMQTGLRELDGTFITTSASDNGTFIKFHSQSIRDYMLRKILEGDLLEELINNVTFFGQAQWYWEIFHQDSTHPDPAPHLEKRELSRYSSLIIQKMRNLVDVEDYAYAVIPWNIGMEQAQILRRPKNLLIRMIALSQTLSYETEETSFGLIENILERLVNMLEQGQADVRDCMIFISFIGINKLRSFDTGEVFLSLVKDASLKSSMSLLDFEEPSELFQLLPHLFSTEETANLQRGFLREVENYVESLANSATSRTQEDLHYHSYRIGIIGDALGVETVDAQQTINDYAGPDTADDEEPENIIDMTEDYTGTDLDSIFSTLSD